MAEFELMEAIKQAIIVGMIPLIMLGASLFPIPIAMIVGALREPKHPVKPPSGLKDPIFSALLSLPFLWIANGSWGFLNGGKGSLFRALYEFLGIYDFDTRLNFSMFSMLIALVCLYYALIVGFWSLFKTNSELRPLLALSVSLFAVMYMTAINT
jgi:heme A synthase